MIDTRFWIDDYVSNLDPSEKLLFLYFLTNPYTDICGVYEIPLKHVALETGLDKEMVIKIVDRFSRDNKIFYENGWVAIKNFAKHQQNNPKVAKGIEIGLSKAPKELLDRLSIDYDSLSHLNLNSNSNSNPNPNSNLNEPRPQDIVNYFFELKGWDNKSKEFYAKNKIIYGRYTKPAKELLFLCDNNLNEARECLDKLSKWAISHDLDWSIETVFKKWYDIDHLKIKEKKPFIEGQRAFKKLSKWYLIDRTGEIKEYVGSLDKIEYK